MEKSRIDVAITLARLYGIAETLNPIPWRSPEAVRKLILGWVTEYMESEEADILCFFERKMEDL